MRTDKKNGQSMVCLLKKERNLIDVASLNRGDIVVIEQSFDKPSVSDYFITAKGSKTYVTSRYNLRDIPRSKQPNYIRDLVMHIAAATA